MKRAAVLMTAFLLLAGAAFAADVPASDNEGIAKELARTEARFLAAVEGLTDAQWSFKPAPDRWSIAECAEHIASAEPMIRSGIDAAMKKQLPSESVAAARQDDAVLKGIVDRSQKFKAPEPLQPTNRFGSGPAAVEAFRKERAETVRLATASTGLRTTGDKHFAFGPLDSYGWLLFLSAHSERHTLQIEEVKADPNFPKP